MKNLTVDCLQKITLQYVKIENQKVGKKNYTNATYMKANVAILITSRL